jgi:hypothetical protein
MGDPVGYPFGLIRWATVAGMVVATLAAGGCGPAHDDAYKPNVAPTGSASPPVPVKPTPSAEAIPTKRSVRLIPISRYGTPMVDQSGREGHLAVDASARLSLAAEPTPCCDRFQIKRLDHELFAISTRSAVTGQKARCVQAAMPLNVS